MSLSRRRCSMIAILLLALNGLAVYLRLHRLAISSTSNASDNHAAGADRPTRKARSNDEPYVNRWQKRFYSSTRNNHHGILFFKHIRKAGGTLLRSYLHAFLNLHGHGTLRQFVQRTEEAEARRHFPFLDWRQQQFAEQYYLLNQTTNNGSLHHHNNESTTTAASSNKNKVFYVEQEFSTMDWQCRDVDPRWNQSLRVIALRHPVERHLSEFFYSGPPAVGEFDGVKFSPRKYNRRLRIDRTRLYHNATYTGMLSKFLGDALQSWAKATYPPPFYFKWFFRPRYIDNFQLRALAGCASGECLMGSHITDNQRGQVQRGYYPSNHPGGEDATPIEIDSTCTTHPFYKPNLHTLCTSKADPTLCSDGCDGPCFYPAVAWGERLTREDLDRAKHSLEGFDAIFLTETMDDKDQLSLLADVMGAPRSILSREATVDIATGGNVNVEKRNSREKTHYYRDLMINLTHARLMDSLMEENKLEIELYEYAVRLNKLMTERWKKEYIRE